MISEKGKSRDMESELVGPVGAQTTVGLQLG